MAISFPAPEAATKHQLERASGESTQLSARAGHLLKRGYERVCSAIFDPDGDCMRF
jgi:hypothetical protein